MIASPLANTGTLYAVTAGSLTLEGAVSGAGTARINGGTLYAKAAFSENVTFTGTTGVLELAHSQTYTGKVSGLSTKGTSSLDLLDIVFTKGVTKATYSGSKSSGILTVTDGTHTAKITLLGNYTLSTFKVSDDTHGGTSVVDPHRRRSAALQPSAAAAFRREPRRISPSRPRAGGRRRSWRARAPWSSGRATAAAATSSSGRRSAATPSTSVTPAAASIRPPPSR